MLKVSHSLRSGLVSKALMDIEFKLKLIISKIVGMQSIL